MKIFNRAIVIVVLCVFPRLFGQNLPVSELPVVQWTQGGPGTALIYSDGEPMKIVESDGAILAASPEGIEKSPDRVCFLIILVNKFKDQSIDIDPDKFALAMTRPRQKQMQRLSPESVAQSIERDAARQAGLVKLSAAFAEAESTSKTITSGMLSGQATHSGGDHAALSGSYLQSSTTKTSSPDVVARERSLAEAQQIQDQGNNKSLATSTVALKHNTLLPGHQIAGYVWFKWDKHADEIALRIPLMNETLTNGVVYEFSFTRPGPLAPPSATQQPRPAEPEAPR